MGYSVTRVLYNNNKYLSFREKSIFSPSVPTLTKSIPSFTSDAASSTDIKRYSAKPKLDPVSTFRIRLLHMKHRYDKTAQAERLLWIWVDLLENYWAIQVIPVHDSGSRGSKESPHHSSNRKSDFKNLTYIKTPSESGRQPRQTSSFCVWTLSLFSFWCTWISVSPSTASPPNSTAAGSALLTCQGRVVVLRDLNDARGFLPTSVILWAQH